MVTSSHHIDKRIYVLLLLVVGMLIGLYVISFEKLSTGSKASSYDDYCKSTIGDTGSYCSIAFARGNRRFGSCGDGFTKTEIRCGPALGGPVLGNLGNRLGLGACCTSTPVASRDDYFCRSQTRDTAAYCSIAGMALGCRSLFTKTDIGCGVTKTGRCCVSPGFGAPTATPTTTPSSATGTLPTTLPTARPTAGYIPEGQTDCPLPEGQRNYRGGTCSSQGNRWGPPDSNGNKTCYNVCGKLYTADSGATWCTNQRSFNLIPCCQEALTKPFLFSNKVCCNLLSKDDIVKVFGGSESVAKQNCPNQF